MNTATQDIKDLYVYLKVAYSGSEDAQVAVGQLAENIRAAGGFVAEESHGGQRRYSQFPDGDFRLEVMLLEGKSKLHPNVTQIYGATNANPNFHVGWGDVFTADELRNHIAAKWPEYAQAIADRRSGTDHARIGTTH